MIHTRWYDYMTWMVGPACLLAGYEWYCICLLNMLRWYSVAQSVTQHIFRCCCCRSSLGKILYYPLYIMYITITAIATTTRRTQQIEIGSMTTLEERQRRKKQKLFAFLVINLSCMIVEFIYGFLSNSLSLTSDACHMVTLRVNVKWAEIWLRLTAKLPVTRLNERIALLANISIINMYCVALHIWYDMMSPDHMIVVRYERITTEDEPFCMTILG